MQTQLAIAAEFQPKSLSSAPLTISFMDVRQAKEKGSGKLNNRGEFLGDIERQRREAPEKEFGEMPNDSNHRHERAPEDRMTKKVELPKFV